MQHPREREGFSKTDSTQYCRSNSRDTQNQEGVDLLAAPPMHKIQQNGNIKDYLNHTDRNKEWNWRHEKQSIPKDEARRKTETKQIIL